MKNLILFGFCLFFLPVSTFAQDINRSRRTLTLTGECLRKVDPDRGGVRLVAEFVEPSAKEATRKANELYTKLQDAIKKLKLQDLEMESIQMGVREDFMYPPKGQAVRKYRGTAGLHVESSEMAKMGEILKIAQELGVQNVSGPEISISPQRLKESSESCLKEAFMNAREKAQVLAQAGGFSLGGVLSVEEAPGMGLSPVFMAAPAMMKMDRAAGGPSPGLESKAQNLRVQLGVVFEIK